MTMRDMIVWEALQQFVDNSDDAVDEDSVLAEKVAVSQSIIDEMTVRFLEETSENAA